MCACNDRSSNPLATSFHIIGARNPSSICMYVHILIFTDHKQHNDEKGDELYEMRGQTSNVWKIHSNKIEVVIAPEAKRYASTPPLYFWLRPLEGRM